MAWGIRSGAPDRQCGGFAARRCRPSAHCQDHVGLCLQHLLCTEVYVAAARRANRDSIRMVQAEAAYAMGDAGGALTHLKAIASRWPASAAVWNLHTRAMAAQVRLTSASCDIIILSMY